MLTQYQQRTQLLLGDKDEARFNVDDLTLYINMARGQLASETECVRVLATLSVDSTTQVHQFSAISLGVSGVNAVISINQITYAVASGSKALHTRPFSWFNTYILSQPNPTPGPPAVWTQYSPGSTGSFYLNVLDGTYSLSLDCICQPNDLADDSSPEAISYPLTDAVPFFSAYYAALSTGDDDRAKRMYDEYQKFTGLGKIGDIPSVLPLSFTGSVDPFMQNRLGVQQQKGGQP